MVHYSLFLYEEFIKEKNVEQTRVPNAQGEWKRKGVIALSSQRTKRNGVSLCQPWTRRHSHFRGWDVPTDSGHRCCTSSDTGPATSSREPTPWMGPSSPTVELSAAAEDGSGGGTKKKRKKGRGWIVWWCSMTWWVRGVPWKMLWNWKWVIFICNCSSHDTDTSTSRSGIHYGKGPDSKARTPLFISKWIYFRFCPQEDLLGGGDW